MGTSSRLERSFLTVLENLRELGADWAVLGGLAVAARTEPRFTRDIDLAVAVKSDEEAERLVHALVRSGYRIALDIEQTGAARLATIRLVHSREPRVFIDLLFASSGIEPEIVRAAERLRVLGADVKVATVGHLIATKILSRDDSRRPRDTQDLAGLLRIASPADIEETREALRLMEDRGFSRGRDLREELAAACREMRSAPPGRT
ncbi:MAG TPA: hypothetical protein DCM87_03280 [Planctomycetes bacterium]|nr:hypothetical protein [Planctomycetota bacterium]